MRVVAESAVRAGLERIAEVSLAIGPSTAFDVASDVVWVDVGGCAHLHGGEDELARALEARVRALGHACRVAIADGPRLAAAVARFSPTNGRQAAGRQTARAHQPRMAPIIVPEGRGAEALGALPVEALDLDIECITWLRDLGLRTCGDLQGLPRRSLGTRLGERTKDVMQLLGGEDRAPLDVWRPPEVPEERVELEWGTASVEALAFITRALCNRLAARLEGRAMATARIALVLGLDRDCSATTRGPMPPRRTTRSRCPCQSSARPICLPWCARNSARRASSPGTAVTLRALELTPALARPLDLLTPNPEPCERFRRSSPSSRPTSARRAWARSPSPTSGHPRSERGSFPSARTSR